LLLVLGLGSSWEFAFYTLFAFILGSATSIASGAIGMKIATAANGRTTLQAVHGVTDAFNTAFNAGAVMGFALVSLAMLVLWMLLQVYSAAYAGSFESKDSTGRMFEALAGYGLGGSVVALFGRVGGGIYTKAADVGADLVGKVERNIPEDDPRNPAVIADNVGDNVGDIAGMGADLFGSFAEATCAAMVISAETFYGSPTRMLFPLAISASGILVGIATTFFATKYQVVRSPADVEPTLKKQLLISTAMATPVLLLVTLLMLPFSFQMETDTGNKSVMSYEVFFCVACGLWSGLIIGYCTEYFTSSRYSPVREVSNACETGAATNIIYGLALGYQSAIVPVFALAVTIYVGFSLAGTYGIAMAALGILSTLTIGLTIDAYGPISDNAGGIAEMAGLGPDVRDVTDCLDAAGNTTAAVGKGFAIGSAALVSLALFRAYVSTVGLGKVGVNMLDGLPLCGILVGALLPYWFSAMTMKSVGKAALAMVTEVRRQFATIPGLMEGTARPDYARCVEISTEASLKQMIAPGALVIFAPIVTGFLFGTQALAGLLIGALTSGVQLAISASNTGGAWDNAKKYIEAGAFGPGKGKGSDLHKAAVVGDTVGDPLKDTSGPSLNILIKLMAIIALVFAPSFPAHGWITSG